MKTPRIFALALLATVAATSACSSSDSTPAGTQDKGAVGEVDTSAAAAPDKSPDGVAYPTDNVGRNPRQGGKPGNTMVNYKFLGYPDGDVAKGLQPLSMASFFDPKGTKYKMIHIQASATWCVYCQQETQIVAPLRQKLLDKKVAWIISLAEGKTPNVPATVRDLENWISQFRAPYTHMLDPGNRNFGQFYDRAALPWNATVNAKTMEIVDSHTGGIQSEKELLDEVDAMLEQIDSAK